MALLFELVAEFGQSRQRAEDFVNHFDGLIYKFSDDRSSKIQASLNNIWEDQERNLWCRIIPEGVSITGRDDCILKTAEELTSIGLFLYERLRLSPAYRYAYIGYEVEEFRTFGELLVNGEPDLPGHGVVLSTEIYNYLGQPSEYLFFAPEYVWVPWQGADL